MTSTMMVNTRAFFIAGRLSGKILAVGIVGLIVSLGIAGALLFDRHHTAFNTTNDGVSWGLPIATYVYFVLSSTGLTFIASLAMVFGIKEFYPIAKRCIWLAIAMLLGGFACLALELGDPIRMLWAVPLNFAAAYTSPMNWMALFYSVYLILLLLKFQKINAGDWTSPTSKNLGIASFCSVCLAHGTIGLLFGMMATRPFWFDAFNAVYFLASAFLSGAALATMITYVDYSFDLHAMPPRVKALMLGDMPKVFAAAIGVVVVFVVARTITGLWSNLDGLQVYHHMVSSPIFWIEIVIGMFLPFFLLLNPATRNQPRMQMVSAFLVLVALFVGRYEYVVRGQMGPLFKGAWVPGYVAYTPSIAEWMLTLLAVSVALTLYAFGEIVLDLTADPKLSE